MGTGPGLAGRRLVLAITLLFVAVAGVWGDRVFGKLSAGEDFTPPDSQSQHEANLATRRSAGTTADVVVLYSSPTLTGVDPAFRSAVRPPWPPAARPRAES